MKLANVSALCYGPRSRAKMRRVFERKRENTVIAAIIYSSGRNAQKHPGDLWKPFRGALSRMIHGIDSVLYAIRYGSITRDLREDRRAVIRALRGVVFSSLLFFDGESRTRLGSVLDGRMVGWTDGWMDSIARISSLVITSGLIYGRSQRYHSYRHLRMLEND